ncbi:MAG: hypothetical protein AB7E32_15165 [Desulfovibrio sp.]
MNVSFFFTRSGLGQRMVVVLLGIALCLAVAGVAHAEGVGGIWRTNWVDMMLHQSTDGTVRGAFGAGGHGGFQGKLDGTRLNALWSAQPADGKSCPEPHEGKAYWGEVEIHFGEGELSGSWSACGDVPTAFTGRRLSAFALDESVNSTADAPEAAASEPETAPQAATQPQAASEPVTTADTPAGTATAPANGQRKTPPPPPFRGGEYAYLERFMPLRGEFALPMFRGDNPRVWSVVDDQRYPFYEAKNPKTGYETLTWRYTALVEGTIDEEGKDLYETYISVARGDAAAIEQEFAAHRTELEGQFKAGSKTGELEGIKRIDDFDFGQGGYILVRGDRQDMHEIRWRDNGLLITVRCSPWWGGMDYCPFAGAAVDRNIRKARKSEGQ